MKRLLPFLFKLLYLEVGVLLMLMPWTSLWTRNYFVQHSPSVAAVAKNYFVRGAVSGIGLADVWVALYDLWHVRRRAPH
jgi:hypothetical protein